MKNSKKKRRYGIQALVFVVLVALAALYYFRREGLDYYYEDSKCGFVDPAGDTVIALQFTDADGFHEGLATASVGEWPDDLYGFIDKTGTIVIEPQYDYAGNFHEGMAWVKKGGQYGFIDKTGNLVIDIQYDDAGDFSEGMAWIMIDDRYGYVDKEGRTIVPQFDDAGDFSEGLAPVKTDGEYGYINKAGEMVIEPQYELGGKFSEGLAWVCKDGKYGFIDQKGELVFGYEYDFALGFSEGLACVEKDYRWGYIDKLGQQVIGFEFDDAQSFFEGLALVMVEDSYCDKNGKLHEGSLWGYIDKTGHFVIEPCFETADHFSEGYAFVSYDYYGTNIIIDKEGNEVAMVEAESYERIFNQGLCPVFGRAKYGLCKTSGKHLTEAIYDDIDVLTDNFVRVKMGDKYGFLNGKGEALTEIIYDYVGYYNEKLARVLLDDKEGLINKKGILVVEPQYDEIGFFDDDFDRALVYKDGKYGYIDENGEVVIDIIYDDAPYYFNDDGNAVVEYEGKRLVIDTKGRVKKEVKEKEKNEGKTGTSFFKPMSYKEVKTIEDNPLPSMPSELLPLVEGTDVDFRNSAYGILYGILSEDRAYYNVNYFSEGMVKHFVTFGFIDKMVNDNAITNVRIKDYNDCMENTKEEDLGDSDCDDELEGWGSTWTTTFVAKLLASEQLQNILYNWVSPVLHKLYADSDMKLKMCMADVVNHMIDYTARYDHEAECSFYLACQESDYGEDLFNTTCMIEDMEPYEYTVGNPYRPFETWVFRRVREESMTAEQIHGWLVRFRNDLNLGGWQELSSDGAKYKILKKCNKPW